MSHWLQGKLENLTCSIDKMRLAIVNVIPEWEGHLEVSPQGSLVVHSSYAQDTKTGYHIRVAENGAIGVRYCDFGMKQLSDGTWHIQYDSGGLPPAMKNAPAALKDEVNAIRTREIAKSHGILVIEDAKQGSGVRQRLRMSSTQIEEFVKQMS